MQSMSPIELSQTLALPPSGRPTFFRQFLWLIILLQLAICVITSIGLSYMFSQILFIGGKKSWKKAREIMKPIEKRLRNLEKEKVIWSLYLEWMEDYCAVYYGLLNYLNTTVMDLDKLYKDHSLTLKNLSDSSLLTIPSELQFSKAVDSQCEILMSDPSLEGITSDEDVQLVANFARVFANLKSHSLNTSCSGDIKRDADFPSSPSLDLTSTNGTNEESGRDEVESLLQTSDEEIKFSEISELSAQNMCNFFVQRRTSTSGESPSKENEVGWRENNGEESGKSFAKPSNLFEFIQTYYKSKKKMNLSPPTGRKRPSVEKSIWDFGWSFLENFKQPLVPYEFLLENQN